MAISRRPDGDPQIGELNAIAPRFFLRSLAQYKFYLYLYYYETQEAQLSQRDRAMLRVIEVRV